MTSAHLTGEDLQSREIVPESVFEEIAPLITVY